MRMGTVIGRVTLSVKNPRFVGQRLLLTLPWNRQTFEGQESFDPAIVVYDELGGGVGQHIAISEGREAACPFKTPTPVDAYCAALVDEHFYNQQP
ncbi:MAG: EutN/CcmL family microcompartment protein [Verrucomicrobiota bacterium]